MKKFLSLIVFCLFCFNNFSAYALSPIVDDYLVKNKTIYENQLNQTTKWKKFITTINKFLEKNAQNETKINELLNKIESIDISQIKKQDTVNSLMYLSTVLKMAINDIKLLKNNPVISYEKLSITVYDDKRCTNCPTQDVIDQLKLLPSIAWVDIVKKDFSDAWVEKYLKDNEVTALPLIEFSTNNFDVSKDPEQFDQNWTPAPKVNTFLQELPKWSYTLAIWATFNPFEKRSARWFLILDKSKLQKIKDSSYIKWNKNAKITWIEYSDLECPFCAKLHNDKTSVDLIKKYWDKLNIIFNHFPLEFHWNAQIAAEALECTTEQKWADTFYSLIDKVYEAKDSSKTYLIDQAVILWANKTNLEKCINDSKYTQKVKDQMKTWVDMFGISWTPWNVLINNDTWEYEILPWAYPKSSFETIIDGLLK